MGADDVYQESRSLLDGDIAAAFFDAVLLHADTERLLRSTVAADKGYDTRDLVASLRVVHVTPHVAQHTTGRRSAIDARTTRHPGYTISQQERKLVEQAFGWMKTIGGLRKLRHRGGPLVDWIFTFTAAGVKHRARAPIAGGDRMTAIRSQDPIAFSVERD